MSKQQIEYGDYPSEVFVTQEAFRQVMDAMARPGLLRSVPAYPGA